LADRSLGRCMEVWTRFLNLKDHSSIERVV
jgi:hypothetical protein